MELLIDKQLRNLKVAQLEEIRNELKHVLAQHKASLQATISHADYLQFKKLQKYLENVKSVLKHKIYTKQA